MPRERFEQWPADVSDEPPLTARAHGTTFDHGSGLDIAQQATADGDGETAADASGFDG